MLRRVRLVELYGCIGVTDGGGIGVAAALYVQEGGVG
jgi:hypothetical protein